MQILRRKPEQILINVINQQENVIIYYINYLISFKETIYYFKRNLCSSLKKKSVIYALNIERN